MTKAKVKKSLIIICSSILLFILFVLIYVYFLFFHRYTGRTVENIFNENDTFDISTIKTLEKKEGEDFVILNLADIQLCDIESPKRRRVILSEVKYLIETIKPDLITLTGDQTWSNENLISITAIINLLDSYKIPWAPVFGNHDYGNDGSSAVVGINYLCQLYEDSEYCLFERGPTNIKSLGNYAVNIVENDKIVKTLYFMDAGYGTTIVPGQQSWFKWTAEGIKNANGNEYTESMLFIHKPLYEYREAYYGGGEIIGECLYECSLWGLNDCGFFDVIKERGVKNVVCGHQHTNMMTLLYQDVYLTFALKTGEESFYYDDGVTNYNGATYFVISDAETTINNFHVKSGEFHLDDSENIYDSYN